VRDPNGFYADRWDRPRATALKEITLIDQASAARAYLSLARVLQNAKE
jgi:hypothetical protein